MTLTQNQINQAIDYSQWLNHYAYSTAFQLAKISKSNFRNYERNGVYFNEILISKLENIQKKHNLAGFLTNELFYDRSTVEFALRFLEITNDEESTEIQSQWLIDFWESNKKEILNYNK